MATSAGESLFFSAKERKSSLVDPGNLSGSLLGHILLLGLHAVNCSLAPSAGRQRQTQRDYKDCYHSQTATDLQTLTERVSVHPPETFSALYTPQP